jgi:hypothetical protein
MNDLSQVTAICVDTRNHELAVAACWNMAQHGFARVVLVTDQDAGPHLPDGPFDAFRVEYIEPLQGRHAYSRYVLDQLMHHVHTSHALIFQWDGFVLDASRWRPEFLEYDYIGAIWPSTLGNRERSQSVGNGGFCLRSSRLMRAVAAMPRAETSQAEDEVICLELADRLVREHQVRFAPPAVAKHFSVEYMSLPTYEQREPHLACTETFGFHGFFNFDLAFGDFELMELIDDQLGTSRADVLRSWHAAALIAKLARAGRTVAAAEVTVRCAPLLGLDPARISMHDVLSRFTGTTKLEESAR